MPLSSPYLKPSLTNYLLKIFYVRCVSPYKYGGCVFFDLCGYASFLRGRYDHLSWRDEYPCEYHVDLCVNGKLQAGLIRHF